MNAVPGHLPNHRCQMSVMEAVAVVVSSVDPSHGYRRQRFIVVRVRFLQMLAHKGPVGHFAFTAATLWLDYAVQQYHL